MHKQINDKSFYEVSCYVATSFEECADYIRAIHTTDTGALPWSDVAKKRFENISDQFSVTKFEKIANSKVGKEFLKIDNTGNILTHASSIKELEEKLAKIIKDINDGTLKNENIKNATEMKKYLYGENEKKISIEEKNLISPSLNKNDSIEKSKEVNKEDKQDEKKNKLEVSKFHLLVLTHMV